MRVVMPGDTGQVGRALQRSLLAQGPDVVVLGRGGPRVEQGARYAHGDGRTTGTWPAEVDGADPVVNLVGRRL